MNNDKTKQEKQKTENGPWLNDGDSVEVAASVTVTATREDIGIPLSNSIYPWSSPLRHSTKPTLTIPIHSSSSSSSLRRKIDDRKIKKIIPEIYDIWNLTRKNKILGKKKKKLS